IQALVDLGLVGWVSVADDCREAREFLDDDLDLLCGHAARRRGGGTESGFGLETLRLSRVDPLSDLVQVATGVDGGPVPGQPGVASRDGLPCCGHGTPGFRVAVSVGHGLDRRLNAVWPEFFDEPVV